MSSQKAPEGQRIGALSLFSLVYTTSAAALYFALGLIAQRALGLTPLVFLGGGLFLGLAAMSYTEGVLGHPEPGGSSSLTRFAFNELVSFAAGWAVVLDFLVVIALAATTAASYLGTLWTPVGHGLGRTLVTCAVIGYAVASSIRGGSISAVRTRIVVAIADIGVQALLLVLGAFLMFHPELLSNSIHFGSSPTWTNLIYAFTLATAAFTGIEAAASLAPEINLNGVRFRRLIAGGVGVIVLLHVGIAFVGLSALPVTNGLTELGGRWLNAPLVGVARGISPGSWGHLLGQVVAVSGFVGLATASRSAMTGVSRLAYSLARHRQIPRVVARLSSRYGTPWIILILAGLAAAALALPADIEMLGGLYAFGAMLAITLTHASVVRLRLKGGLAEGAWAMPLSVRFRGGTLPLPALFGAIVSAFAFLAVMALHAPARYVGSAWLLGGVVLYVIYRKLMGNSVFEAVEVSDRALVYERESASYGSILVPILGSALDDDIVQTAGRLAGATKDELDEHGAVIEAIWFHEIPLSLPLDASISPERSADALERLRHAKAVGEEYQGVTVSTAQVRVRKLGQGIVREAKRRGVDVIVLPGEEPTRAARTAPASRGKQAGLGEMTKFVLRKAHCRVLVTVPSSNVAGTRSRPEDGGEPEGG